MKEKILLYKNKVEEHGGIILSLRKIFRIYRDEGIQGVRNRIRINKEVNENKVDVIKTQILYEYNQYLEKYAADINVQLVFKEVMLSYYLENRDVLEIDDFNLEKLSVDEIIMDCLDGKVNVPISLQMLIVRSYFDSEYYSSNNLDVRKRKIEPLYHFCVYGWMELRKPREDFDILYYCSRYLSFNYDTINPLMHYALMQSTKLCTKFDKGYFQKTPQIIDNKEKIIKRRVCLFAGYDVQNIMDDYVIEYIKELSKYCDVYYLADSTMVRYELDKIKPWVKKAWSFKHDKYDFGSYSILANELVGWEELEKYDEVLLCNDSCYLLTNLDNVFDKMDYSNSDWWGLQATKGIYQTLNYNKKKYKNPISIKEIDDVLIQDFQKDYIFDFYVGSYFIALRRQVINAPIIRRFFENIKKENKKKLIVMKYEIGLTKLLIEEGFKFDTYSNWLYPMHPVYDKYIFNLLDEGFPLFKRYLLSENHYSLPGLKNWKSEILKYYPEAKVDIFEKNLNRVSNSYKLFVNFNVKRTKKGAAIFPKKYSNKEMLELDKRTVAFDNYWVFPVCAFDHTFSGNERAIFEYVKNNKDIKKIILTRSKFINVDGVNVEIYPHESIEGQILLLQSKIIFIKHTPFRNVGYPLQEEKHYYINLWHGIPLKRIGVASIDQKDNLAKLGNEHKKCRTVISSSKIDSMAMASAFYPLMYNDIWVTGLPRADFILMDYEQLPSDFKDEMDILNNYLGNKKLVLYCPTFRNYKIDEAINITPNQILELNKWLKDNNAMLGIRDHMANKNKNILAVVDPELMLNLSNSCFYHIEVLLRRADILITDYSSTFIDFILLDKPMISFAYDYDNYMNNERGFFYDFDFVFPGEICKDVYSLLNSLERLTQNKFEINKTKQDISKKIFFDYIDSMSSSRVVAKINELING
ncbi:CDP-glycerol glycerophosphotransferase family protein [Thorsellia anophelis]|uniref:CDP-glycerol glycerophosphotransferase, TagB/SpsB family n=1 Tax=Thorsellia anophelis DSM 18579 TaxID=1123402 RepID=A0A1I0G2H2_9GAMM|nr:CDP-glycerol glycerophosphotransferase family protein [Thorsellia anophelis]SET64081.1 CDP-glycerol glycerophosphotransferase, TagB/SpsB family [Thorsellia anophelis DSM 18579]